MAATVVTASASSWARDKPADYKSSGLDKALSTYEALDDKISKMKAPIKLIDAAPKASIREFDACIALLKTAITEYEKHKTFLNQVVAALKAVQAAAGKTSAELIKLSKGKDVDEAKYKSAAQSAQALAGSAGNKITEYS